MKLFDALEKTKNTLLYCLYSSGSEETAFLTHYAIILSNHFRATLIRPSEYTIELSTWKDMYEEDMYERNVGIFKRYVVVLDYKQDPYDSLRKICNSTSNLICVVAHLTVPQHISRIRGNLPIDVLPLPYSKTIFNNLKIHMFDDSALNNTSDIEYMASVLAKRLYRFLDTWIASSI